MYIVTAMRIPQRRYHQLQTTARKKGLETGRKQLGHKDGERPAAPARDPNLSPVHTFYKQKTSSGLKLTTPQLSTTLRTKTNILALARSPTGPGPM